MKIIAITNCDSWLYENFGCRKLINSWKYFHPDIPIIWYNENETNRILLENKGFDEVSYMPIIMKEVKEKYKADLIIKLDADSLILDRLIEIIDCNDGTEILGVRNDGDHIGNRDESMNRPYPIENLPNHLYVNCGCIATNSNKFLYDWYNLNKEIIQKYNSLHPFIPLAEQGTYNIIFHSARYKTKILDPLGGNLFYGASANIPVEKQRIPDSTIKEYNGKFNNWNSWQDIKYNNKKFWLYNKQVKIIHAAGGGAWKNSDKLDWDRFDPDIIPYLKEITKC